MKAVIDILLLEDDKDDIELLEEALRENNVSFKLEYIMQGDKIIPRLNTRDVLPDVIVMDLNIPKIHGKEILKLLKKEERFADIPVLVLSTSSSLKEKEFCLQHGARLFLKKPTTAKGFKEVVTLISDTASGQNIYNS